MCNKSQRWIICRDVTDGCRRHVDCSSQPDNEEELGNALEETFGDWIVNRPDVFVTARLQESNPENMVEASQAILKRLRTKYVDLLLLPVDHIQDSDSLEVTPPHFRDRQTSFSERLC
jgi:diketogulonate reductase-like aldo/keto reductase